MTIDRYDPQGSMYADPDGEWVRIVDHFKALVTARAEGHKQGLEEAAKLCEDEWHESALAYSIRKLKKNKKKAFPKKKSWWYMKGGDTP